MIRNYRDATVWVADLIEPYLEGGEWKPGPSTFEAVFLDRLHRGLNKYDRKILDSTLLSSEWYLDFSQSSPQAFDAVARHAALRLREGALLDKGLAEWMAQFLEGTISRPKEMHRPRVANWSEKALKFVCAVDVARRFELRLTRNDESDHRLSASDVVAEAFTVCGLPTKYQQVKRLVVHPDHERFRDEVNRCVRFAAIVGAADYLDAIGLDYPGG